MTEPAMRYCDLVMKGGITSGVVYPAAILELRKRFHFKNIGGTSAGAIAASAAAAASLGERRNGASGTDDNWGFAGLQKVADQLQRQGVIRSQFQPAKGGEAAFRLLVLLAGPASRWRKAIGLVVGSVLVAPLPTLATLGLLLGIGYLAGQFSGVAAAALPALIVAMTVGMLFGAWRTARLIRGNFFGLCSGMPNQPSRQSRPAFTVWLHDMLQSLAGIEAGGAPLLFDDLWSAPRHDGEPDTKRAINLQLITTAVSHREPRTLPFERAPFWFRQVDFDRLFPVGIVDWLVAQAGPGTEIDGQTYHRLPAGGGLPVVVATRMSLSFPLLFSAIPLYEPVWDAFGGPEAVNGARPLAEAADNRAVDAQRGTPRKFRVCWFSDGGICSNFPLHLFDAPVPNWPTFAVDLVYPAKSTGQPPESDPEASVFLPTSNNQGWQRTYRAIGETGTGAEVGAFLLGVIGAARSWREQLQARSPGHRDRIVRITLDGNEGGLNLDMPSPVLEQISRKGAAAGRRLAEKFEFDNHFWLRWRTVSAALQRHVVAVARGDQRQPKVPDYAAVFETARIGTPPPVSYKFVTVEARKAAEALLADLVKTGSRWADDGPDLGAGAPRPTPHLQIVPAFDDTDNIFDS